MDKVNNVSEDHSLLLRFNNREIDAFAQVYNLYYRELVYYTKKLYGDANVVAQDVVHDIFIKVWEKNGLTFSGMMNIKAYLYTSIRNSFFDYLSHTKCATSVVKQLLKDPEYNTSEIIESETLSIISEAIDLLPDECAKVFKLYLDGWNVKEISEQLNKAASTVYAQKQESISILKKKLTWHKLIVILLIINN